MHNTSPTPFEPTAQDEVLPDSTLCMIPPHPALNDRLRARLQTLFGDAASGEPEQEGRARRPAKRKTPAKAADDGALDELIGHLLRRRGVVKPGHCDGLVVPGTYYPLGTSLHVARHAAADRAPLTGTVRVIVVLVNFKDKKLGAAHTKKHFTDLFFSTGVLPHGSVKEYYKEVTNGAVSIEGEVAGPFTLSQNMAYYAHGKSGTGGTMPNARTMAQEAAQLANPSVNFGPYDNDGNGYVDAFIVIHAGQGAEQTGKVTDIWSHKWVLPAELNADGTKIYGYLTVPEDSRIGVCCHELGHLLFGFPDLYDTDYSSEGVGDWCLMGGGSWNGDGIKGAQAGDIPSHPSAWCKTQQGWVSTIVQTKNATVTIKDVKVGHTVYRLWKNGTGGKEYFLLENRQRTLYDQDLPGDGLLIWHIDDAIDGNTNEAHPQVKLVEADALNELESGANRGNAGDPFPGSTNNISFTNTTTPGSKSYAGLDTCVSVTKISASGPSMTARLGVKCGIVKSLAKELNDGGHKSILDKLTHPEGKPAIKEVEKPVIDKSAALDKPGDKFADKLSDGGLGGGGGGFAPHAATGQPFISASLRPDLTESALLGESDVQEVHAEMQSGSARAKRFFDSKAPEV